MHATMNLMEAAAATWRDAACECLHEAAADRGASLVTNVVLLGPLSRNGYRYAAAAMEQAAPLYEGRPVFIDHPERAATQRRLRDYAGQVVRARYEGQRLRGDVKLLGPNAGWLLDLIEAAPQDVGMSHVILGRRSADGKEVLHIERVLTVDIVAFPATTQTFKEQETPWPGGDDRWPEFQRLLAASRIPPEGRRQALRHLLGNSADPLALIAALERYWDEVRSTAAISQERQARDPGRDLRQALIHAIRGN
jgi:hypothetical protein